MFDPVKEPLHYSGDGKISCMDAMRSMLHGADDRLTATATYWWGCAFKYLWRWLWKNGVEDLEKCEQCIGYLKEEVVHESISRNQSEA